jgi:hypothetical protein
MKKLILAAVLATLAGSTAFAQSYNPQYGTGNVLPFAYAPTDRSSANSAYAQETGSVATRPPHRVTGFNGAIKGDPDPNIAFQLHRDAQEGW